MTRRIALVGLIIGFVLHADWHLARPGHVMSLHPGANLPYHWVITALLIAGIGWFIAQRWPADRWRIGAWSLAVGVLFAQGIEPLGEALIFQRRIGFLVEPARWTAFWLALAASIPVYLLALWLCAPSESRPQSAESA